MPMVVGGSSGRNQNSSKTALPSLQAKVDKVLARAGLQASPFDPQSLEALKQYLAAQKDDEESNDVDKEAVNSANTSGSSLEQIDIYSPTSGRTKGRLFATSAADEVSLTASAPREASNVSQQDRLMEQLQLQTSLILDLQRKIDRLSGRVEELEKNGARGEGSYAAKDTATAHHVPQNEYAVMEEDFAADIPPPQPRQPAAIPRPLQQQQQHLRGMAPPAQGNNRESRFARFVRIYIAMRRRQVPNLEWGLIFKVVIMMAILFSRLGADWNEMPLKFYALATFLVVGFLFQSGYAQFLYKFFVQENYFHRILVLDEDVELDPPPGPAGRRAPRPGGGGADPNDGWFDWRETFLGGRIQRAEAEPQAPFLWRLVRETFLLVFSLVLSIFPMWHPEPPPPPPPAPPAPVDNTNENTPTDQQPVEPRDNFGPGVVQPPVDPTEPEDDDEGNDDDDSSWDPAD